MFRSITRFFSNTRGAFAMQFAMMAIPLTVCAGLAIDGGRAFLARFELSSALDAAALAVGSTLQEGADLDAIAARFVERNFRTPHDEPVQLELVSGGETLLLRGSVTINTYFMPLVGQPYVTVAAESEVRRGGTNIEVAMALDITGSMNETRMTGLKAAANILIEEVVNPVQTPFTSTLAIVPWSQSINLATTGTGGIDHTGVTAVDLRGSLTGSKTVSGATWRSSGTSTMPVAEAGWRTTAGPKTIANAANNGTGGVDWRWGTSKAIASFARATVSGVDRILVTTSNNHGYSDGQYVRITGASASSSFSSLNNTVYRVGYTTSGTGSNTTNTYYLKRADTGAYIVAPTGTITSSTAAGQRCFDSVCNVGVTTTADFSGLAAGDRVNITGVSGFPGNAINNSDTTTWAVATVVNARSFTIADWDGPNFGTGMNSGGGRVSECLVSDCRYRVTTGAVSGGVVTPVAHNFSNGDYVYLWNFTEENDGLKSANSALNTTWRVEDPSGGVFYLPGKGNEYNDWDSGGSGAECALATCNTRITVSAVTGSAPGENIVVGDRIELKNIGGMTGLNNPTTAINSPVELKKMVSWKVSEVNGNVLTLADTSPAYNNMANSYTSGGTSQCLVYGCAKYGFKVDGGSETNPSDFRVYLPTPCIVERFGAAAATDANPATSPLGINYTANGTCTQTSYVTPLTADKTRLTKAIADLKTSGSTAGHLGIAWAWYMLSENFRDIWDKEPVNKPRLYTAPENAKIAILMTDGEFNFASCDGVPSASWGSGTSNSCDPSQSPYDRAQSICTAMKLQDITIYTVGLQLNAAEFGDDFLRACATTPEHAFLAGNNAELEQAFRDIAVSISRLRISR